jgi:glycosyltransferase involved in cell wall biosynthesis
VSGASVLRVSGLVRGARRSNRIAIIYPVPAFETHPTLRNAALLLARAGYTVDVFVRRDPSFLAPTFEEKEIRVCFMSAAAARLRGMSVRPRPLRLLLRLAAIFVERVLLATAMVRRHLWSRYRMVIGVDPAGIVLAAAVGRLLRVPVAYMSLELLLESEASSPVLKLQKARERSASRQADIVIVQDEERARLLREDNALAGDRFVLVPNAPLDAPGGVHSRFWHERFGLPDAERIVLHAGSFAPWTGLAEIIGSTHAWPAGWSLVVHLRERATADELERLAAAAAPGRVVFSPDPVPQDELDALFASGDVGIAFYVVQPGIWSQQENLSSVGLSSGKLAYYLRAGLPVIVNEGTSLSDFVREEGCGVVVSGPAEIGDALARIAENYDGYRAQARRTFAARLDFAAGFGEVIRRIDELSLGQAAHV